MGRWRFLFLFVGLVTLIGSVSPAASVGVAAAAVAPVEAHPDAAGDVDIDDDGPTVASLEELVVPGGDNGGPSTETFGAAPCQLTSGKVTNYVFEGKARTFKVVMPRGSTSASRFFVTMHGATGTAEVMEKVVGLPGGVGVVLYPQATGVSPATIWNATPGSEDVRFVAALVEQVHMYGCGSPDTTSISGFSMGAMMTGRVLCSRPNLFASAVMVAGALPPPPGCRINPRTSIMVMHGTSDYTVPYDGTLSLWLSVFAGGADVSVYPGVNRAQMAALWQRAKGCEPASPQPAPAALMIFDYTSCGTAPTRAVAWIFGGHTWDPPGRPGLTTDQLISVLGERGVPGRVVTPAAPAEVKLATGATTVLVNVTVTAAGGRGYTVLYPCGSPLPLASTNSYAFGETTSTMALVTTNAEGKVCVHASTPAHVVVDSYGWAGVVVGHSPLRLADTRAGTSGTGGQRLPGGSVLRVPSGASDGTTVFANVTVTGAVGNGFTTVFPCGAPQPTASTNNFVPGRSSANFAVVGTDANGDFCVYTSTEAHIVVDSYAENSSVAATAPARLADTRTSAGGTGGSRLGAGQTLRVHAGGTPGETVVANVTVTGSTGTGYTTVFSCDQARPGTSAGNFARGQTSANGAVVRTDANGDFCVYTTTAAHLVVDSYAQTPLIPIGVLARAFDSRQPW